MAGVGGKRDGAGRPKGVANKATQDARAAIAEFVDGNAGRLVGWLDVIAKEDPKEAFKCFMSVVEYHIPKLQRSEQDVTHKGKITVESLPQEQLVGIEAEVDEQYGSLSPQLH